MKPFFAILFFLSEITFAATIVEEFTSLTQKNSATAIWNVSAGKVHPTMQIENYEVVSGTPLSQPLDIGDGSHGAFNTSTYANFGTVVGSLITVNTAAFPTLKVTSFDLAAGYTLTTTGGPLVVYSQSDITVSGIIECSGGNATGLTGGTARCGGRNGGNGGGVAGSGILGGHYGSATMAGGGGIYAGGATGAGGGGGTSYGSQNGFGGNSSLPNTGGSAGTASNDPAFSNINGGTGGGGGSGSTTEIGGGGGAGGGSVVLHARGSITITAGGLIRANGGNGATSVTGGGGGGGGGGAVKAIAYTAINLNPSAVVIEVNGGTGAVAGAGGAASDGSNGGGGRTWLATFDTLGAGGATIGPGSESHPSTLPDPGNVRYLTTSQTVVSNSYDTTMTDAQFSSIVANPSTGVTVEVAGSTDNFAVDDSGWLPAASISSLNNKRYVKFRLTLANVSGTAPLEVDNVIITYSSPPPPPPPPPPPVTPPTTGSPTVSTQEFNFKGCALVKSSTPSHFEFSILVLLLLLPLVIGQKLKLLKTK